MDMTEPVDIDYIKNVVEMKEMDILMHGGKIKKETIDFRFICADNKIDTISKRELLELFFRPFKKMFKENVDEKTIAIFDVVYPGIENPMVARGLHVFAEYLSTNDGLLGIETTINNEDNPVIRIYYLNKKMNKGKIWSILTQKKWKIKSTEGIEKEIDPAISFISKK